MGGALGNARTPTTPVLPDEEIFELMGLTVFRA
jgi:hypothetical protein